MDEVTKKKYCHLLMFDSPEPGQEPVQEPSQEEDSNNDKSDLYDIKPCANEPPKTSIMAATTTTVVPVKIQRKLRAKKQKGTPRPPNAFILYRKAKQSDVIARNKGLTNAEVSKVISKMWWKENEEERFQWEKRADRMKLKHTQDFPDYVYKPRKPGIKKRKSITLTNPSAGIIS